jgi:hypothetical protein
MNIFTLCLICSGASLVIFVIALIMGQARMRQIETAMRQLAEKHGATFTPGTLIYNPYITFRDHGLDVRLYGALGGRSDPSHTELRAILPEDLRLTTPPYSGEPLPHSLPPFRGELEGGRAEPEAAHLSIRPHSFLTRLTVTLGAKPYLIGERAFDAAFDVRGAPDALLRRILTPQARQQLLAMKDDRPVLRLWRKRSLLPQRLPNAGSPDLTSPRARLGWAPHRLHFYFYTAGLPAELAEWEPRLEVGRMLLDHLLDRPAPDA